MCLIFKKFFISQERLAYASVTDKPWNLRGLQPYSFFSSMHLHIGETTTHIWLGFIPVCRSGSGLFYLSLSGAETKEAVA